MRKLLVLAAIVAVAGLATLGGAQAGALGIDPALAIACGQTVMAGTWTVTNSISGCGAIGLRVTSNVNLDCNDHTIGGSGGGLGITLVGSASVPVKNVHIMNCHVKYFANNFNVIYGTNVTLRGDTSIGATGPSTGDAAGFYVHLSDGNTLTADIAVDGVGTARGFLVQGNTNALSDDVAADNGFRGFDIGNNTATAPDTSGDSVKNSTALNNGDSGFAIFGLTNSVFTGNRSISNSAHGFSVLDSNGNTFTSNAATGNGVAPDCDDGGINTWTVGPSGGQTNVGDTSSPPGICIP